MEKRINNNCHRCILNWLYFKNQFRDIVGTIINATFFVLILNKSVSNVTGLKKKDIERPVSFEQFDGPKKLKEFLPWSNQAVSILPHKKDL